MLEVCVDSYASALAAIAGGADRLEVCSALSVGGLTPSPALVRQIWGIAKGIPIRCLMRPRGGDFLYTKQEIRQMEAEMLDLCLAGAGGFVIGCLTPDGDLDMEAMEVLTKLPKSYHLGLTLHRCIDVSRDLQKTYRDAASLGMDTVLTSGGAGSCLQGMDAIKALTALRDTIGGPEVLVGAGVKAGVIETFLEQAPGCRAFHMSGKQEVESGMRFRREGVPMGIPGLDAWHLHVTSEEAVRSAKAVLTKKSAG